MRKGTLVIFFLFYITAFGVYSQPKGKENYILPKIKPQLEIIKHEITPGHLAIYYNINFSGVVELRIFNRQNKIVLRDQFIINKIDKSKPQNIKVNLSKLTPGQYTYALNYKNKEIKSNFSVAKN